MLTDALKAVKNLIFKEEYQNKNDTEIKNEIDEISAITEVSEGTIIAFFNHFSSLKLDMDRRGISTTKNLDWTSDQVAIMMLFMAERKQEKIGVEDAFNALSDVLDKTKSGIQYKFYETKKSLKSPKKTTQKETRGRKPKSSSLKGIQGGKKVAKVEEKQEDMLPTEFVAALASEEEYQPYRSRRDSFSQRERGRERETRTEEARQSEIISSVPAVPTYVPGREEEVDVADLITGMIQDFGQIERTNKGGVDTYQTILDLFKGLRALSSLAAAHSGKAKENESLSKETSLLRTRMQELDKENLELMKNYNEMATTIQQFQNLDQVQRLGSWKETIHSISTKIYQAGGVPTPEKKKLVLDKNLQLSSR